MTTDTTAPGAFPTLARRQRTLVRNALEREALDHATAQMRQAAERARSEGMNENQVTWWAGLAGYETLRSYALPYGRILAQEARERGEG